MSADGWQSVVDSWRIACARYPDDVAVEDGAIRWSYRELEKRAQAWGAAIAESTVAAKNVAIQLPHCAEAIAAMLGALGSGRCIVPLDHTEPVIHGLARLQFSESRILISWAEEAAALSRAGWKGRVIAPESVGDGKDCPPVVIDPGMRAHVYFTSGSSGDPKAVAGWHRTAARAAAYRKEMFAFRPTDRHALFSPLEVAASFAQIFAVFSAGARLCLFEARNHNAAEIADWLDTCAITTFQMVPSLFRMIAREVAGKNRWRALRAVKLGGEAATATDARLFAACAPENAFLINGLGLTEAGFNVCWWTWRSGEDLPGELLPIGRPPFDLELAIETSPGSPALDGEIGEIVVRSPAFSEGYWRNPKLNAAVYRELPDRPGWRELRTGDAGCWRDGFIEYKGRLDATVKIRGRRVTPMEIEAALLSMNDVIEAAVVLVKEPDRRRFHAFVRVPENAVLKPEDLRKKLTSRVPAYMIPARISLTASLPYLPNGKIDRARLSQKAAEIGVRSSTPNGIIQTAVQRELAFVWEKILDVRPIGLQDDFFALGGDSLAAMAMLAAVEKWFGTRLPLAVLLEKSTLGSLGDEIENKIDVEETSPVVPLRAEGNRPPLFCVPSAGSSAFEFRFLATHLSDDQPVYAFQSPGLDGHSPCLRSLEELADLYLEGLREYQPHGPYYLCGNSFGGLVAFEIGRRLVADDEDVRFLGLLDSFVREYPKPRRSLRTRKRLKLALLKLLPHGQWTCFRLSEFKKGLKERAKRWLVRRFIALDSLLRCRAMPCPWSWRSLYVQEACFAARRRYRPRQFPGRIDLFRVERQPPGDLFEIDPFLGWNGLADNGITVHELPGYHNKYLRDQPTIAFLARQLSACLDQARRNHSSQIETSVSSALIPS